MKPYSIAVVCQFFLLHFLCSTQVSLSYFHCFILVYYFCCFRRGEEYWNLLALHLADLVNIFMKYFFIFLHFTLYVLILLYLFLHWKYVSCRKYIVGLANEIPPYPS